MEEPDIQKANITEIFSSVQGEGPFVGIKQIFVRFSGCNACCGFCDQDNTLPEKEFSVDKLLSIIKQIGLNSGDHHSVSFTGGEPLLQKDFIKVLVPGIREIGSELKIYLETNATLPVHLKDVIDLVDIVALDFKLPSSTGCKDYWKEHKEFLSIAKDKHCFVKAVITSQTKDTDIKKAINIISSVDKDILLVLQPVWPVKDKNIERAATRMLFDFLFLAEKKLKNVRIMPQMHKILKVK